MGPQSAALASPTDGNHAQLLIENRVNPGIDSLIRVNCSVTSEIAHHGARIGGLHDVQKLPSAVGSTSYGPELRVYACPNRRTTQDFQGGVVVAFVHLLSPTASMPTYANLGLGNAVPGFFCLWVGIRTGQWSGAMTRVTSIDDPTCPAPVYDLLVRRTSPSSDPDDYPPGVRILDSDDQLPLLGVPCESQGGAWCEVGNDTGRYERPENAGVSARAQVKGWHDEQTVAYTGGNAGGPLHRGARAWVIPEAGIDTLDGDEYRKADPATGGIIGVRVATVRFRSAPGEKYSNVWGLRAGKNGMWIRRAQVGGVDTIQVQFARGDSRPDPGAPWFYAKHQQHKKDLVPANARWLWESADETIWLACDQGCCEVTTGFSLNGVHMSSLASDSAIAAATKGRRR